VPSTGTRGGTPEQAPGSTTNSIFSVVLAAETVQSFFSMVLRKRNAISRQEKGETFFTGKIRNRAFDP
jgi:hypothetical protein